MRPPFRPSLPQAVALAVIGAAALGIGLYVRYRLIEQSAVGIACETGAGNWLCAIRRTAIALFAPALFGWTALVASLLNLIRPKIVLVAVALASGGVGLVLYNTTLSAFAVAILILSLARPAPEPE